MSKEHHRFGLSYFEAVMHRTTLSLEIGKCFDYFEKTQPKMKGDSGISLIHVNGIELKRVKEGKGFSIEIDGVVKIVGKDQIDKKWAREAGEKIQNITIPYAEYLYKKRQKH